MKKILLTAIFVSVFSGVGATAQTVFIPQPTVINIPLLDPSRMIIQNEINRNTINGAEERGGTKGTKPRPTTPGVVDYTMFNARQENYMPKVMAQSVKGSVAEQRQAEQFYNAQIADYEWIATNHHLLPANDVASAFVNYILINYQVYYDLYDVRVEKDPWAKRARSNSERTVLMNEKKSLVTTEDQDRLMYYQLKKMLSAKPEFRKMIDRQKQEMTETMAIMSGIVKVNYLKAIEDEDERQIQQAHEAAKAGLEKMLGVPINKIKFNPSGLQLQ